MTFDNGFHDKQPKARPLLLCSKGPAIIPLEYEGNFLLRYANAPVGDGYDDHAAFHLCIYCDLCIIGRKFEGIRDQIYDHPFDVIFIGKGQKMALPRKLYPGVNADRIPYDLVYLDGPYGKFDPALFDS